jgi:uncharacterized protein involved in exopolysaccharide biosynthesis
MQIELTSRGLLAIFFKHLRKILFIFTFCVAIGLAYALTVPREYMSSAGLIMKFGRAVAPEISRVQDAPEEITTGDRREQIQSTIQILQSRDLLRALVNHFTPERIYPDLVASIKPSESGTEAAITKMQTDSLVVRVAPNSTVIDVALFNRDPQLAADILNKMFQLLIKRESELFNKPQLDLLNAQLKQAREKLDRSQLALQQAKEKTAVSNIDEEIRRLLEQKTNAVNVAMMGLDRAKDRLELLQAEETRLLATYQSDSPNVQRLRQSIGNAQAQVSQRQADLRQGGGGNSSANLLTAEASRVEKRIAELESARTQINDLQRQVEIDDADYRNYAARSESARIEALLNEQKVSRVEVMETPNVPTRHARPRRLVVILLAVMAGAIFASAAAIIKETFDEGFTTPGQLAAALRLPVMGSFFMAPNLHLKRLK